MTRDETLRSIVKRHNGVTGLCKHINASGAAIVTEHELVALTTEDAKRQYGISNGPQAFNRRYRESEGLQRALVVIKTAQFEPIGGGEEVEKAMQQLRKLVDRERARSPGLTSEQAFTKVFTDPANAALAARAYQRRQRPRTMLSRSRDRRGH